MFAKDSYSSLHKRVVSFEEDGVKVGDVVDMCMVIDRYVYIYVWMCVQPIADRVAQHLEIISQTFPTNQNSAHGIYD